MEYYRAEPLPLPRPFNSFRYSATKIMPICCLCKDGHNDFALCNAALPKSVIRPRASKSAQRCLFSSVQWLRFCRGERRCASRPSFRRLSVESIHPKQSASSTTSRYGRHTPSGFFLLRYIAIQQHFSLAACCSNHSLSCDRSLYTNRSTISIIFCFSCEVKEGFRQVAVAIRMFVQIVLMILIGGIEILQRQFLYY